MAGRPRQFDEQATLDAAMLLFWRQGYEATSLAELREVTGLSSASLYNAFGSKEGLFERVVAHYVQRSGSVMSLVASSAGMLVPDALDRLLHVSVDEQLDVSHPPGCLVALSATVGPGEDGGRAGKVVLLQRHADLAAISSVTDRGIRESLFVDAEEASGVATLVHTFILGIATKVHDGAEASTLHAAARALSRSWR